MSTRRTSDFALYRRLVVQARPYWPHIAAFSFVQLLATPIALLSPWPLKIAVDSILGTESLPALYRLVLPDNAHWTLVLALTAAVMLGLTLLGHLQGFGAWLLQTWAGEKLVLDFRSRLFRHLQRLSLTYHDMNGTTDSAYRVQCDAYSIQKIAVDGIMPLAVSVFSVCGMIIITARMDWQLAVVALSITPFLFLLSRWSRARLREKWTQVKDLESDALSVVHEVLGSVRVVKAFAREDYEQQRFVTRSSICIREMIRASLLQTWCDTSVGLVIGAGTAASLIIGVSHVRSGMLTIGDLTVAMAYLGQLYGPLGSLSKRIAEFQAALAGAERAFEVLDEIPDVAERPDAQRLKHTFGEIEFRNVSFRYPDGPFVHQDMSFHVRPGARVGISGMTGAGKTTLLNLLMRFYDPVAGAVLLDGTDVREYTLADLRNQFALVHQDAVLFSATIAENIAYARPDATREQIEAAAIAANAHEFISSMPQGYATVVGERGMRLSGGERQRISLARAFLKNAPILLLDEPTSAVDIHTEAAIMDALERLMKGRTTFMIAHRLSTLDICDVRFRIERGRLVEVAQSSNTGASRVF